MTESRYSAYSTSPTPAGSPSQKLSQNHLKSDLSKSMPKVILKWSPRASYGSQFEPKTRKNHKNVIPGHRSKNIANKVLYKASFKRSFKTPTTLKMMLCETRNHHLHICTCSSKTTRNGSRGNAFGTPVAAEMSKCLRNGHSKPH